MTLGRAKFTLRECFHRVGVCILVLVGGTDRESVYYCCPPVLLPLYISELPPWDHSVDFGQFPHLPGLSSLSIWHHSPSYTNIQPVLRLTSTNCTFSLL